MAFSEIEDLYGKVELIVFPDAYQNLQSKLQQALKETEAVLITGEVEIKDEAPKLFLSDLQWLKEVHRARTMKRLLLTLDPDQIQVDQMRSLKGALLKHRGKCPVTIHFRGKNYQTDMELPTDHSVEPTAQTVADINAVFGTQVTRLE